MTRYYVKIDKAMLFSTVWKKDSDTNSVWMTLLLMADQNGYVYSSIPGLAEISKVTTEKCLEVLDFLMSPDEFSRTKDNDGIRITEIDGGWHILNAKKYRQEDDEKADRRKEQNRLAKQKERDRKIQCQQDVSNVSMTSAENADSQQCQQCQQDQDHDHDQLLNFSNEKVSHKRDLTSLGSIGSQSSSPLLASSLTNGDLLLETYDNKSKLKKTKKTKRKKSGPTTDGSRVWDAYARAYEERYEIEPVRNTKQNSICKKLVERLGATEAVGVAAYYPSYRNGYHVSRGHALPSLLADCETIRTAWVSGVQITQTKSREDDRLKATGDVWNEIIAEHQERDRKKQPVIVGQSTVEGRVKQKQKG